MPTKPKNLPTKSCPHCHRMLSTTSGLKNHIRAQHTGIALNRPNRFQTTNHPNANQRGSEDMDVDSPDMSGGDDSGRPNDGGQDEGDDDWDGLGDPSAPIRDDSGKAKDDEVHERHPYINGTLLWVDTGRTRLMFFRSTMHPRW